MNEAKNVTPKESLKAELSDVVYDKTQWEGRSTDGLLQWLVDFVIRTDISIAINLTIGGNIVSGMLIPHKKYFETLSEDISALFETAGPESAAALKRTVLSLQPLQHTGIDETAPQFLHLEKAHIFSGKSGSINSEGMLWRGKISAVEGFSLGMLRNGN